MKNKKEILAKLDDEVIKEFSSLKDEENNCSSGVVGSMRQEYIRGQINVYEKLINIITWIIS